MKITLKSLSQKFDSLQDQVTKIASQLPEPPKTSNFLYKGDGTILDKEMNLVWAKEGSAKEMNWEDAKKYCEENKAGLPGTGWRMPTRKELASLVDDTRYNPAINPIFSCQSSNYWSSTRHASYSDGAWSVDFSGGYVYWNYTGGKYCVRPVRQNS